MAAKTKGNFTIKWKRPAYDFSRDRWTATLEATGPHAELVAQRPVIGATFKGFAAGYKVERVRIVPGQSSEAKIIVDLTAAAAGGSSDYGSEGVDIPELDSGSISRPIERHPNMPRLKPSRNYYEYPDRATHSTLNKGYPTAAAAENLAVAQRTFEHWQALDAQDINGGTWTLEQYKSLKEAGKDDYSLSFPIARLTTFHRDRPSGVGSGVHQVSNPPGSTGAPSGWTYVKTMDGCRFEGDRWRRVQEWEGQLGSEPTLNSLIYGG